MRRTSPAVNLRHVLGSRRLPDSNPDQEQKTRKSQKTEPPLEVRLSTLLRPSGTQNGRANHAPDEEKDPPILVEVKEINPPCSLKVDFPVAPLDHQAQGQRQQNQT